MRTRRKLLVVKLRDGFELHPQALRPGRFLQHFKNK